MWAGRDGLRRKTADYSVPAMVAKYSTGSCLQRFYLLIRSQVDSEVERMQILWRLADLVLLWAVIATVVAPFFGVGLPTVSMGHTNERERHPARPFAAASRRDRNQQKRHRTSVRHQTLGG